MIYDNNLYAFDTQTADKIWSVETDDYANRFVETPSAALGKVYANKSGELIVLDQFSGEELWSWRPQNGNNLQGSIVLTLNIAFVQDNINTYAIDLDTHEQVWSYPVSGKISLSKVSGNTILNLIIASYEKFFTSLTSYNFLKFKKKAELMSLK